MKHGVVHRARTVAGVSALASAAIIAAQSLPSSVANADTAVKVGWFSSSSPAPSPTTPAGGMRVSVAPGQVFAYGAIAYDLSASGTATLELTIAASQGSGQLQACPTTDTAWKGGDDQPMSAAPAYDCSKRSYQGDVSADGKTATFLLDGSAETTPGVLSVAIVPVQTDAAPAVGTALPTDATEPYDVDFAKPSTASFTVTSGGSATTGTLAPYTPPAAPAAAAAAPASGGSAAAGSSPQSPPSLDLPDGTTATVGSGTGSAPVVATGGGTPAATTNSVPLAAGSTATANQTRRNISLALLVLLALGLLAGPGAAQRSPRLLRNTGGPRHRAVAEPAPVAVAAYGHRGLGRFGKARTAPPRPLI